MFDNKKIKLYPNLNDILYKNKAMIAGGFVLSHYVKDKTKFKNTDIDIYVNERNFDNLIDDIIKQKYFEKFENLLEYVTYTNKYNSRYFHTSKLCLSQEYDKSFFKKNGIKFKVTCSCRTESLYHKVDIMIVNDDRKLEDVFSNFDLSFTEIWYDGKKVFANDEKNIRNMFGILKKDYVISLFQRNIFILKRMEKYRKRGFDIKLDSIDKCENFIEDLKENMMTKYIKNTYKIKTIKDHERWFVKKILMYFYLELINIDKKYNKTISKIYEIENDNVVLHLKNCIGSIILKDLKNPNFIFNYLAFIFKFINSFHKFTINELIINLKLYFGFELNIIDNTLDKIKNFYFNNSFYEKNMSNDLVKLYKFIENKKNLSISILENFEDYPFYKNYNKKLYSFDNGTINLDDYNGFDIINIEENTVKKHLEEDKNNIVFLSVDDDKVTLFSIEGITFLLMNIRDNWFYECKKNNKFDEENPYIKLSTVTGNIYIPWFQIYQLYLKYLSGLRIFAYKNTFEQFEKTASHKNVFMENPDYVSANHCQQDSNINLYNIYYLKNNIKKTDNNKKSDSLKKPSNDKIKSTKAKTLTVSNRKKTKSSSKTV
tara:strand:+ start:17700 stop:19499 length:1800 start_codon:yes stop_codon:yes gene_type:complete